MIKAAGRFALPPAIERFGYVSFFGVLSAEIISFFICEKAEGLCLKKTLPRREFARSVAD